MANSEDRGRKAKKVNAIVKRLAEIHENRDLLINMLDETKIDLIVLALGIGAVDLT